MGEVGVSGGKGRWVGVLRKGGQIVASCPHLHANRDSGAAPARSCAQMLLRAATHAEFGPEIVTLLEAKERRSAQVARTLGARISDEERIEKLHTSLRAFGWQE